MYPSPLLFSKIDHKGVRVSGVIPGDVLPKESPSFQSFKCLNNNSYFVTRWKYMLMAKEIGFYMIQQYLHNS